MKQTNQIPGLYDPSFEHDNCGIGACVNIKGVKNHQTVDNALKIVETLEHRAGKDAAGETGDGVGIMLQISHKFFSKACKAANINIGKEREYGIGMFFFPNDELRLRQAKKMFEIIVEKEGMTFLGWREVPTTPAVLGKKALECMPKILQGFVAKPADVEKGLDFDRKLYIARKVFEQSNEESYVVSLSSRTIVYKGMFLVGQLIHSLTIFRIQIMNQRSHLCIHDSVLIRHQAGRKLIHIVLSYIMEKSIPSVVTPIRCLPEKKIWNQNILKMRCTN